MARNIDNCTANQEKLLLEGNSDIAGMGVLIGFIGSAYLVLIMLTLNYIFAYDPTRNPFGSNEKDGWQPNPIDKHLLGLIQPRLGKSVLWKRVRECFDECVMDMCDVQIMTGFGILISGFLSLDTETPLSAYHWQMITSLAWFSCVTHFAGLAVLRGRLNEHPWMRNARIVLTVLLVCALILATIPTRFFNWDSREWDDWAVQKRQGTYALPQSLALCYFDFINPKISKIPCIGPQCVEVPRTTAFQNMIFTDSILVIGLVIRCIQLFQKASDATARGIREPISKLLQSIIERLAPPPLEDQKDAELGQKINVRMRVFSGLFVVPALAVLIMLRTIVDCLVSMFTEIIWLVVVLLWGTFKVIGLRNKVMSQSENSKIVSDENSWTFGQVLAITPLVLPVFSMTQKILVGLLPETIRSHEDQPTWKLDPSQNAPLIINAAGFDGQDQAFNGIEDLKKYDSTPVEEKTDVGRARGLVNAFAEGSATYNSAKWLWAYLFPAYLAIFTLTALLFVVANNATDDKNSLLASIGAFWITSEGMLGFLLVGFPVACTFNLILCLEFDSWFRGSRGMTWKYFVMFLAGTVLQALFFMTVFGASPADFLLRHFVKSVSGIGLARVLCATLLNAGLLFSLYFVGILFLVYARGRY